MRELPNRKHPRLKEYDYGQQGCYFVTVCTEHRKCLLSRIAVGRGLAPAETQLTAVGKLVQAQLLAVTARFPHVTVDNYVIMPNHIHILFSFGESAGASPRPTLSDVVCAFKSLTAREYKAAFPAAEKLFQASYYDHVVRSEADYLQKWQYIENNPARWAEDELFCE